MKTIGLTGGIGSGKSIVAKMFSILGVPVYNSDKIARSLYFKEEIKARIIALLGQNAYLSDVELNKAYISSRLFSDSSIREALNNIIHPAVAGHFEEWRLRQMAPYVLKESALIFETNLDKKMDAVIVVTAPLELKIERVQQRDQLTRVQVLQRMEQQMSDDEKLKKSELIIYNSNKQLVIPQVLKLHSLLSLNL